MSAKTRIADPSIYTGGLQKAPGRKWSFYLFEAGEFDGAAGYWAVVEHDENEEGLLSTETMFLDARRSKWTITDSANAAGIKCSKKCKSRDEKKNEAISDPTRRPKAHLIEDDWCDEDRNGV